VACTIDCIPATGSRKVVTRYCAKIFYGLVLSEKAMLHGRFLLAQVQVGEGGLGLCGSILGPHNLCPLATWVALRPFVSLRPLEHLPQQPQCLDANLIGVLAADGAGP